MNGWLVLARCGMDDIPLRLYANRKLAYTYAENATKEEVIQVAFAIFSMNINYVVGISVLEFTNGVPGELVWMKDIDPPVNLGT